MPARRLDQLADVLLTSGIYVIEDAVRAFFRDGCRGEARTATCAASRLFTAGLDRRTGVRE